MLIIDLADTLHAYNHQLETYTKNTEKYILTKSICGLKKGSIGTASGDTVVFYTNRTPVTAIELSKTSKLLKKKNIENQNERS